MSKNQQRFVSAYARGRQDRRESKTQTNPFKKGNKFQPGYNAGWVFQDKKELKKGKKND